MNKTTAKLIERLMEAECCVNAGALAEINEFLGEMEAEAGKTRRMMGRVAAERVISMINGMTREQTVEPGMAKHIFQKLEEAGLS